MRHGMIRAIILTCLTIAGFFGDSSPVRGVDYFEGFDDVATLPAKGWTLRNLSSPPGTSSWFQGNDVNLFPAQDGPPDSYLAANYLNTTTNGTISNWAITPTMTYQNGDTFRFWTRTETGSTWPDRLEVRMSSNGASENVGNSATSVGDFTALLLSINPTLAVGGYPQVWTEYVLTLSGLTGQKSGRIAFRYFVTNSGPSGTNGNYIGIDTLRITTVPEPSTYLMALVSAAVLCRAGRRFEGGRARVA